MHVHGSARRAAANDLKLGVGRGASESGGG